MPHQASAAARESYAGSSYFAKSSVLLALGWIMGCGDDQVSGDDSSSAASMDPDVTGSDVTGIDETGTDSTGDSTGDETAGEIIPDPPTDPLCEPTDLGVPILGGPFSAVTVERIHPLDVEDTICPDLIGPTSLTVLVYRPDPWPDNPVPFVVHVHGEGHAYDNYDYIGTRLAEEGYVFMSIAAGSGAAAEAALACTMSWIGSGETEGGASLFNYYDAVEEIERSRLRCDAVIMGHSQGGNAARRFVSNREEAFWMPYWFDKFRPVAYIGLAPSYSGGEEFHPVLTVPTLLFGAGFDGDTGAPVAVYDETPTEESRLQTSPDRILVWVHDAGHDSFGGVSTPTMDAGTVAAAEYIPRFLQWHVEGENVEENRRVLHFEEFPEFLNDPNDHDDANAYGDLGFRTCSGLGEPTCTNTVGCFWDDQVMPAACTNLDCAEHAIAPNCTAQRGCVEWDGGCVPRPAIYGAYTIGTMTPDAFVERVEYFPADEPTDTTLAGSLVDLDPPQVATGDVLTDFMSQFMGTGSGHETSALLVSWGPGEEVADGTVSLLDLAFEDDLSTATHLSFRIANLHSGCSPVMSEPVSVWARLRNDPAQDPTFVESPLAPVQRVHDPYSGYCAEQTMTTIRIPMSRFCQDDILDLSAINEVQFYFDNHGVDRNVLIDSVEFTRHPEDLVDPLTESFNVCLQASHVYACPATNTLVAERTSCDGEPTSGTCPVLETITTNIPIPDADDGGNGFSGWLVHVGTGIIDNEEDLTPSEEAFLASRCIQACEDEWDDDPFVSANCEAPGAFATPYVVSTPSVGTRQAIPTARQDGSDLFTGQNLECSLHDSCCQRFDELAICPATPARVTPARDRLGEGQEWELTVVGSTFADSPNAAEPVEAAMTGTIGYSFCTEGDGVGCPFYVGSMHLELTEPLEIELECGGPAEMHEITELSFDLVQPALGIGETGTSWKAFPPRAIVVEATGEADGLPVYVRGPIELPIFYQAGEGWTQLQGTGGSYLDLEVPCNGQLTEVKLWWGFSEDEVIASPPSVALDLPDTVECPGELELLLATGSDPDDDLASLDWIVDGVLLSETWPTIDFTETHVITAVLRDGRGAATSASKTVLCE